MGPAEGILSPAWIPGCRGVFDRLTMGWVGVGVGVGLSCSPRERVHEVYDDFF